MSRMNTTFLSLFFALLGDAWTTFCDLCGGGKPHQWQKSGLCHADSSSLVIANQGCLKLSSVALRMLLALGCQEWPGHFCKREYNRERAAKDRKVVRRNLVQCLWVHNPFHDCSGGLDPLYPHSYKTASSSCTIKSWWISALTGETWILEESRWFLVGR